jgi:hypothetical protein
MNRVAKGLLGHRLENSVLEESQEALSRHLAPLRHSALLAAIVAVFAARPLTLISIRVCICDPL